AGSATCGRRPAASPRYRRARHVAGEREGPAERLVLFQRRPRPDPRADSGRAVRRMKSRGVTIVVHVDGGLNTKQYRVPFWAFEVGKWGALMIGLFVVLFFAFAGPLTVTAARSRHLENEVAQLRE